MTHLARHQDLRTEISTRFAVREIDAELATAGFEVVRTWTDGDDVLVSATTGD